MIDRFNFYDIYGYLLPGVLLLSFVWIPLGVLTGIWPPAEWSSAVLALALAYVIGHILHSLSEAALPFEFRDLTKDNNKRVPSDLLLDEKNQVLVSSFSGLTDLAKQIKCDFNLDVEENSDWTKTLGNRRSGVFFRCRNVLVRQKAAGYAEQQQGMYVLMRGAAAALLLSCVLYAGMGIGLAIVPSSPDLGYLYPALSVILFALMIADAINSLRLQSKRFSGSKEKEKAARCRLFWLVAVALFCGGLAISRPIEEFVRNTAALPPAFNQPANTDPVKNREIEQAMVSDPVKYRERERAIEELQLIRHVRSHAGGIVLAWTALSALLTLICVAAYRSFAVNYALQIYRDYLNVHFSDAVREDAVDRV